MKKKRIVIIGAGGFAREVSGLIKDINRVEPFYGLLGFVVSDLSRLGEHDSKDEVLGDYNWLSKNLDDVDALAIGLGSPAERLKAAADLEERFPKIEWPALIHPTVLLDRESCKIGKGVIICAGVIGTVNINIKPFAMVNLACTIGHEVRIGRGTVLNPTANISGGVFLEDGVLVGTGAQILQYLCVGIGGTVGAGAVVTKNIGPRETVVGVPAKPLKRS